MDSNNYEVPELPYAYSALEPVISESIMRLHHTVHHVAYVTKLNAALADVEYPFSLTTGQGMASLDSLADILRHLEKVPEAVRTAVRNNGGGHYNHSFFWQCMRPASEQSAIPEVLQQALENAYGSIDAFKQAFAEKALGLFGSGWVWLTPSLEIITTPNQDSPLMNGDKKAPILGLDVWEHAYYLDYKAARKDYVDAWWGVVNWDFVAQNYSSIQKNA